MEIWVHRNGQYAGRCSESAIRDKVADGSLSATDLAWDEAKSAWKPISELLAGFPVAKTEAAQPSLSSAGSESKIGPSSDAAHPPSPGFGGASRTAGTKEAKSIVPRTGPPPLPTIAKPAAGPAAVPSVVA